MAWFKFTKDFQYNVTPKSVIDYKEGMHLNIKQEAAEAAKAAGAGDFSNFKPKRGQESPADGTVTEELVGDGTGEVLPEVGEAAPE